MEFKILIATNDHIKYVPIICELIEISAQQRGTGIAKRNPAYILEKMKNKKAIIALHNKTLAGFCYLETWSHGKYVANSGLIVDPKFRKKGLARAIKTKAFQYSQKKYPAAKLFGITTSLAVMKINSDLGYQPVTFSELTQDSTFWNACQSCPNYDVLQRNKRQLCLCTGMLAPSKKETLKIDLSNFSDGSKIS